MPHHNDSLEFPGRYHSCTLPEKQKSLRPGSSLLGEKRYIGAVKANRVLLSPPDVGEAEKTAAFEAIASGWVAPAGPHLDRFEQMLASKSDRSFAIGLSSGTAALHLGLLALGVRPGDSVLCSSLTFVATVNAIVYVGASPVFVDSDPVTGNMSPPLLKNAINSLLRSGQRIGAVIPVDFLGSLADYEEIIPICDEQNIPVLADSAESLGSGRTRRRAGSFGSGAIFSFNGNKIATTSGGGAFVTNSEEMAARVRFLSTQAREPVAHYEHKEVGYNYRLSNVLAAIGIAQLNRLEQFIAARRSNRRHYRDIFSQIPGVRVLGKDDLQDNCWLTAVIIDKSLAGFGPQDLAEAFDRANIESRPLWKPMHLQPIFRDKPSFTDGSAESMFKNGLTLPSGSNIGSPEWDRIESAIASVVSIKLDN